MTIKNKMCNLKRIMKILSIIISVLAMPLLVYEIGLYYGLTLMLMSMITFGLPLVVIMLPLANIYFTVRSPTSDIGEFCYAITTFLVGFFVVLISIAPNSIYANEGGSMVENNDLLRWTTVVLSLIVFATGIDNLGIINLKDWGYFFVKLPLRLKMLVVGTVKLPSMLKRVALRIVKLPIKLKNLLTKLISSPISPWIAVLVELIIIAIPFLMVMLAGLCNVYISHQMGNSDGSISMFVVVIIFETLFELLIVVPLVLVFVKDKFAKAIGIVLYTFLQTLGLDVMYSENFSILYGTKATNLENLGNIFINLLVVTWIATYGLIIIFLLANRSKQ
ncbi:hypothetical protein [Limosilactobacillus equigenerosi]|nr:hypothetical protein [Limosilactobacillus equigenerosi]